MRQRYRAPRKALDDGWIEGGARKVNVGGGELSRIQGCALETRQLKKIAPQQFAISLIRIKLCCNLNLEEF